MSELVSIQSDSGRADPRTVITRPGAEVSRLRTACLCWRTATLSSSNWDTVNCDLLIHKDLQAEQSCESLPRVDGFIPHFFIFFLTVSLYLMTGPTTSCPQKTCFRIRLSGMCMTWPTHHSCAFNRNTSIPVVPQIFSTSVLVTLSCHFISAILRKQQRWNSSSLYGLIVEIVSRSHSHTQCSYHSGLIYGNLRFPVYVVHTKQPLLQFTKCTACLSQTRCDVTVPEIEFDRKLLR